MANPSLANAIYTRLRDSINSLELAPGAPLVETELAEMFKASRTPVREAIRRLEAERLVQVMPGRGAFVGTVSVREVLDAYEIRELLEPHAARQAVRGGIDPEEIRRLIACLDELKVEPEIETSEKLAEREALDRDLHRLIAEAAGNELLTKTVLDMLARRARVVAYLSRSRSKEARDEHRAILHALLESDGERAAELLRRHLEASRRRLLEHM